jgi:hypothetical protein
VEGSEASAGRLDRGTHAEHIEVLTHVHSTRANSYGDPSGGRICRLRNRMVDASTSGSVGALVGNRQGHPARRAQREGAKGDCCERVTLSTSQTWLFLPPEVGYPWKRRCLSPKKGPDSPDATAPFERKAESNVHLPSTLAQLTDVSQQIRIEAGRW